VSVLCLLCRSEIDVYSEAGCRKAENLFKELMMKIESVQESLRAQSSYVLEQTLDFSTACLQFKVKQALHSRVFTAQCT